MRPSSRARISRPGARYGVRAALAAELTSWSPARPSVAWTGDITPRSPPRPTQRRLGGPPAREWSGGGPYVLLRSRNGPRGPVRARAPPGIDGHDQRRTARPDKRPAVADNAVRCSGDRGRTLSGACSSFPASGCSVSAACSLAAPHHLRAGRYSLRSSRGPERQRASRAPYARGLLILLGAHQHRVVARTKARRRVPRRLRSGRAGRPGSPPAPPASEHAVVAVRGYHNQPLLEAQTATRRPFAARAL
jgi:hypothetical protein